MLIVSSIKQRLCEAENVKMVLELLGSEPAFSRQHLAKEICIRLELRDGKDDLQIATTSKALRELEDQGLWTLPEPGWSAPRGWNPTRLQQPVVPPEKLPATLEEIRGLRLIEVSDQEHLRIWNELMIREHPLQECRLVGRQLRYLHSIYPELIAREDLAAALGMSLSGHFKNCFYDLHKAGMIDYGTAENKMKLKCADWLFLGQLLPA
jgi:hypothetical protein